VSNAKVGHRLDAWRQQMSRHLTDGSLSELEQECLTTFLQQLCNLRPYLVQCYNREGFPRTNHEMERSIRGRKHALPPHQRSQELEQLSVALWTNGTPITSGGNGMQPGDNNWSSTSVGLIALGGESCVARPQVCNGSN
jgi:hypothetical protein